MIQKHASLNPNVLPPSKNQKEVTELTFSEEQKASRGSDHRHRQVLWKRAMLPFSRLRFGLFLIIREPRE